MSKLMMIAGILLVAVAIALGLMVFLSTASMVAWRITPEMAVSLLVGGVLSVGLGGVIAALEQLAALRATVAPASISMVRTMAPAETAIPEFGRRSAEAAVAKPAAEAGPQEVSPAVSETIRALEQAKSDIRQALGEEAKVETNEVVAASVAAISAEAAKARPSAVEEPAPAEAAAEAVPEAEVEPESEPGTEEGQLYVLEERVIRGRPARLLSDGTVEAETDEGWMRFENLEHLDEYLDAMQPAGRA